MAGSGPIVNVNVVADTKKFTSAMKSAGNDTDFLTSGVKKLGIAAGVAFAAAGVAAVAFGVSAVKAASNLQETSAAIGEIFGPAADSLKQFAKDAPTLLGQTQNEFLGAAKTFGIFGKAAGLAGEENVKFSKDLAILATDLASFNNTSTDDAITALGAALRGESEPIRKYGILLDDATLKARAMKLGIYSGNDALTQQQRVLAANAEIFAQSATQQGDFARTSGGMANGLKILTAQFDNLKLVLGEALYPIVAKLIPTITQFIESLAADPAFQEFVAVLAVVFSDLMNAIMPLLPIISSLFAQLLPPLMAIISALAPIVVKLVDAFMPLVAAILPPLTKLVDGLMPIIDLLAGVIISLIPVVIELVEAFAPMTEAILPLLVELLQMVTPVLLIVAKAIVFLIDVAVKPLIGFLTDAIGKVREFAEGIRNSPLGQVAGSIGQFFGIGGNSGNIPQEGVPQLANGGIVMPRPGGTLVNVGEAGQAEAVIPLSKMGSMGTNITIQGNVGWSAEDLADVIYRKQRQAMALAGLNGIVGVR